MAPKTSFGTVAMPWITTWAGALLFTAMMKLHPIHRQLMRLERHNLAQYMNLGSFHKVSVAAMCYFGSIARVLKLDRLTRQDYFALNRHGRFTAETLPALPETAQAGADPIIIVPGLNTPPVFFRKMHEYFSAKGYPVSVLQVPSKGMADVDTASQALADEINRLKSLYNVESVNLIGHCLGGLIAQYYLAHRDCPPVKHLVTLSTGFLGSKGVQHLRDIWASNHPKDAIPKVFDELINWNIDIAHKAGEVAYHNFATVWDFLVEFQNAFLQSGRRVTNHLIDDADIDHLTIALSPKMFARIEQAITAPA